MNAAERISLEDLTAARTITGTPASRTDNEEHAGGEIVFEPLRAFLERKLPPNESLVGVPRDGTNLLPRFGWVMPWGREGSGKTSILVDLIFHACSGIAWLGYPIDRELKIVVVINEGVPGGLQDKLRLKNERWEHGDRVLDNLAVYASPWGEFTFRDERAARHARDFATDFGADYFACDPLHTLGTTGAGAPEETEAFKHRLREFGLWQDIGILTAHHANKGGMVSGDWARHPDTVIHLEKDGKQPATKLTLQKARPADPTELGVPFLLEWETETLGYRRVNLETTSTFDEQAALELAREALAGGVTLGKTALEKAIGGAAAPARRAIDEWIESGAIVDLTPGLRSFKLTLPRSVPDLETERDATQLNLEQTRMVDADSSVSTTQTERDETDSGPDTGLVPSSVPVPVGDGRRRNGTGQNEDGDEPELLDIPIPRRSEPTE